MMERPGIRFWTGMIMIAFSEAACIYMIILGIEAGDRSGPWLFAAFSFFLGIFLLFGLFRITAQHSPKAEALYIKATVSERIPDTRFVPHWFMLMALLILIAATVYGLITAVLSFFG